MINPFKQEAHNYARRDWPVVPVHTPIGDTCSCESDTCSSPGKHPMPPSGLKEASTEERRVNFWMGSHSNANIGVRTGADSGFFVLDIDVKDGGPESLALLEKQHGQLPKTVQAKTGGGGSHYYFKHPGGKVKTCTKIRDGIDVRGDGGFVVAPPSIHQSGRNYEWEPDYSPDDLEIAESPQWVLDVVNGKETSASPKLQQPNQPPADSGLKQDRRLQGYIKKCPGVTEGERNQTGFRNACRLREIAEEEHQEISCDQLLDLLRSWNDRNSPPMEESELAKIANSVMKRELTGLPSRKGGKGTNPISGLGEDQKARADLLRPFQPFPVHLLPEPVGPFIQAAAKAIGCDPCYIALPLIAALGAAIGNTRRILLKRGWDEPPIFWTVFVGKSGTAKSPAMKAALKELEKLQRDAYDCYQEQIQEFKKSQQIFKVDFDAWKRKVKKDESMDKPSPPTEPEPPVMVRYYCSDTTIEALATLLQNQPRGLLLKRDELAGWFGNFDRYSQGNGADVAQWLEMFNAGTVTIDRKTGIPPTLYIPSASVCVTGGIQPEILKRALQPEYRENGLAARMLYAEPPPRLKQWTETEIPSELSSAISTLFQRLYSLDFDQDENGKLCPKYLPLSADAKEEFVRFYNRHNTEQVELAGDLAAMWSKLEGYAARFALLVHQIRWAARDETLASSTVIDKESVRAGVALSDWFGYEGRRVYKMLSQTEGERQQQQLVDWINNKGGVVTAREVQQGHGRIKNADQAEAALQDLVAAGLGDWEAQPTSPSGGRPTRKFVLAPPPKDNDQFDRPVGGETDDDEWGDV